MRGGHKYDDADYHNGDDVFAEKDLPLENAATHIGFFLTWMISKGMESEDLRDRAAAAVEKVRQRMLTGRDIVLEYCDERLNDSELNEEGNAFAASYYDLYLQDYQDTFGSEVDSTYEIENTWSNYDTIAAVIERRYAEFQSGALTQPPKHRPWWKFWSPK